MYFTLYILAIIKQAVAKNIDLTMFLILTLFGNAFKNGQITLK